MKLGIRNFVEAHLVTGAVLLVVGGSAWAASKDTVVIYHAGSIDSLHPA